MSFYQSNLIKFLIKRGSFIIIIGLIITILIIGYIYWRYFYLPINQSPEVIIKNGIKKQELEEIIKNIEKNKETHLQNLLKKYKDPFK